jgi:hypothetical protein
MGKYKVHKFNLKMTEDQRRLEDFLNGLNGEVIAVIPNITSRQLEYASVDSLLIVEKVM